MNQDRERMSGRLLPALLIGLFVLLSAVSIVSIRKVQGDARVINYAGIVRGATQRLVKQELNGQPDDALIGKLDHILTGLAEGDEECRLSVLGSQEYREQIKKMQVSWQEIKEQIQVVRGGGDSGALYRLSEDYFDMADAAVSAAERYSEAKVQRSTLWIVLLSGTFAAAVILVWFYQKRQQEMWDELRTVEIASLEKSRFLSWMSHEIRTPMNGIIGMTDIARMSMDDRGKVEDCLEKIKLSSDYLLSLINDILDMSRIESGKMELCAGPFNLNDFAQRLRGMFAQKAERAGICYEVCCGEFAEPFVVGDELRLSQVAVNLVSNALKFTPRDGTVRVEILQEPRREGTCGLCIRVSDTGIGMSEEAQKRIFEPFEQAEAATASRYGGTGLGLSISNRLAEMMGGSIAIESRPGEGSCFTVCLRLAPAGEAQLQDMRRDDEENAKPPKDLEDLSGWRILLAEDNELNAEIVRSLLEMKGAVVDLAADGRKALELFAGCAPGTYKVILMDIQMPVMDGLTACREIRACGHGQSLEIPVIGLSANAFLQDEEAAYAGGMNGYVTKPVDMEKLVKTIFQVCRKEAAGG